MKLFCVLAVMFFSLASYAGDSGCGLGEIIIQKNSKGLQLLSWTTNGILFTQPLGITFGTSGCSASGIVQTDKEMQYFVEINNDDLAREMARGEGEKLQVLAQLNGCQDEPSQAAFFNMTKQSFGQIYTQAEEKPAEVIAKLRAQMMSRSDVRKMCHVASL